MIRNKSLSESPSAADWNTFKIVAASAPDTYIGNVYIINC